MKFAKIYGLSVLLLASSVCAKNSSVEECFACPSIFSEDECPCTSKDLELSFKTCLSFDQVLRQPLMPYPNEPFAVPVGPVEHRDEFDRPGIGPDECHGTFEICFNKELTRAVYRLKILNANKNGRNSNEKPIGVSLWKLKAYQAPQDPLGNADGTLITFLQDDPYALCDLGNGGNCVNPPGAAFPECFCCVREFTTDQFFFTPQGALGDGPVFTLAGLYKLIREGSVAVIVNGSGFTSGNIPCDFGKPFYDVLGGDNIGTRGGLIRGQLWGRATGCSISNDERLNGSCFIQQP